MVPTATFVLADPSGESDTTPAPAADAAPASADPKEKKFYPFLTVRPVAFLISPNVEDFRAAYGNKIEDVEGAGSFLPNVKGGVAWDFGRYKVDAGLGLGFLANGVLTSPCVFLEAGGRIELGKLFEIGPHIGIGSFGNPQWVGDADIEFDGSSAWFGGVELTIGKKIGGYVSLDYMSLEFDVDSVGAGSAVNASSIDFSGFMIQGGVYFEF